MNSNEKRKFLFIGIIFKKVEKFRKKGINEDGRSLFEIVFFINNKSWRKAFVRIVIVKGSEGKLIFKFEDFKISMSFSFEFN